MKGLGSFDLDTLLHDPLSQAEYCFTQLFTSFRLRGYFSFGQEAECHEEYRSFVDELRRKYPELHQPVLFVRDTVSFLIEQPSLHNRPLLHKIFRLASLCLDEPFQTLPPVKFGSVDSDNPTSSFVDVVLPVQSYFKNVTNGMESVSSDDSIAAFLRLEPTFVGVGTSDVYSPWNSVDFFGCAGNIEQLDPSREYSGTEDLASTSKPAVASKPDKSKMSGPAKKMSHLLDGKELAHSAKNLLSASCSKFNLYTCTIVYRLHILFNFFFILLFLTVRLCICFVGHLFVSILTPSLVLSGSRTKPHKDTIYWKRVRGAINSTFLSSICFHQ